MDSDKINLEDLKKELYSILLRRGQSLRIFAVGRCMSPILKDGDLITIKYIDIRDTNIGDIVAYKRQGEANIIVHRLIKKGIANGKPYLITKGDASLSLYCDLPVYAENVLGKIVSRQRNRRIINLDSCFIRTYGYIFARSSFYCPWFLKFLRKRVRLFRRIWKIVLRR